MDNAKLVRLNTILRSVAQNHEIISFDKIGNWFESEPAKQAEEMMGLLDEAIDAGYIHQWVEPDEDQTRWDWTPDAVRKARELGIRLVSPLGIGPLWPHEEENPST